MDPILSKIFIFKDYSQTCGTQMVSKLKGGEKGLGGQGEEVSCQRTGKAKYQLWASSENVVPKTKYAHP